MSEATHFRNKKNGKIYEVINFGIINATNGHEDDEPMILYKDEEGLHFVRSESEFDIKFTAV